MLTPLTPRSTGAEALAHVIASSSDAPIVFGLPGGYTVGVFDALRGLGDAVQGVLVREESIATVAAENYGRLTGRPAVVMAQGAWLLGVGGAGIMEAHLGSSPMVIIADTTESGNLSHLGPYQSATGDYGAFDLPAALRAITKRTFVATDPVQAAEMLQLAFVHATTGEPGPVAVVLDTRAVNGTIGEDGVRRIDLSRPLTPVRPAVDPAAVAAAAAALDAADRAVVVVGNGARSGAEELLALVRQRDLPYVSTPGGKGVLPEDGPLSGGVIGGFGHDLANDLLGGADLILAVGTKLGATDTVEGTPELIDPTRQTLIQVDVEPLNLGWTFAVHHRLLGTVAEAATALADAASRSGAGAARVAEMRATSRVLPLPAIQEGAALNPRAVAARLGELLPADSVVTCDAGENRLFMLHDFIAREGGAILQPNGGGAMGHAVPAAVGATYARPESLAVAVLGDGGFAMTIQGLMTAVENERRMLAVVLDNTALGWVLHGQGERPFMSTFKDFDLAAIARAVGARATRVSDDAELDAAVRAAVDGDGVHVVVVPTSLSESFLTLQTKLAAPSHELVSGGDQA